MGSKARTMARAARRPKQSELIGEVLRKMVASIDGNTRMIAELERVVQEHEKKLNAKEVSE